LFIVQEIISNLQLAAMRRAKDPQQERRDFYLYVDEFQILAAKNFSALLSKSWKFRLNLILANQFANQLMPDIVGAIQGNVGSTIIFRTGVDDAAIFERLTEPVFSKNGMLRLPNWHAVGLLQHNSQVTRPVAFRTHLHDRSCDSELAQRIELLSNKRYSRERSLLEKEIRLNEQMRMELVECKLNEISDRKKAYRKEIVA